MGARGISGPSHLFVLIFLCLITVIIATPAQRRRSHGRKHTGKNDAPIIGILAQDTSGFLAKFGKTYFPASYVKYIESAGGRVAPIRNNLTESQLENLFHSINGVLFPGGSVSILTSQYARSATRLFNLALKANDAGYVFPIWGTCLGFEMLNILVSKRKDIATHVDGENYSAPLNFTTDAQSSRMFGSANPDIIKYLSQLDVTFNHHNRCISLETFRQEKRLNSFFRLLSTNRGKEGKKQFVSTVEGYKYPFYGSQWHPEKNQFEWTSLEAINHSSEAVLIAQYMANFFVDQARLSKHHFPSKEEETDALIYQYSPVYCNPGVTLYEQCYVF